MFVDTFEKSGYKGQGVHYIEHPEKYHGKIHMNNKTRRWAGAQQR